MRIKRRDNVECHELPKVESPHIARLWAESNIPADCYSQIWVDGLSDVVWDDCLHNHYTLNCHTRGRLLERLEVGEVLLIHGEESEPVMPVVCRREEDNHTSWIIDSSLKLDVQFNVQKMLDHALKTCGISSPLIETREIAYIPEQSPAREEPYEMSITNPRWEHTDDQVREQRPDITCDGDSIILKADVDSVSDGTRAIFTIFDTSVSPHKRICSIKGEVVGNVASANWTTTGATAVASAGGDLNFYFDATVKRKKSEHAQLPIQTPAMFSIIPMVYTTTDFNRTKAIPLPEGSYVYIFRNKKLYSEFTVQKLKKNSSNILKQIKLNTGALPEKRDTYLFGDRNIIKIPYSENNNKKSKNEELIEVAVSTVQWSSLYIKALENDDDKRSARTQELDFTGRENGFIGSTNLADLDSTEIPNSIPLSGQNEPVPTAWINNMKGSGLLLAYLQDPVMQAVLLTNHVHRAIEKLEKSVTNAKKDPHYDSAVVAYPLLFDNEVTDPNFIEMTLDKVPDIVKVVSPAVYLGAKSTSWIMDQLNSRKQAMSVSDQKKIEHILRVRERREIRSTIRRRKEALTNWLDRQPKADGDFIPFTTGIIDYFSLSCLDYYKAFSLMGEIIHLSGLPTDPSNFDAPLCLPGEIIKEKGRNDAGVQYLKKIVEDEKHPLHKMMFASEDQIPILSDKSGKSVKAPSKDIVPIDGTGRFRHHALDPSGFIDVLKSAQGIDLTQKVRDAEFAIPPVLSEEGQVYRRTAEFSAASMSELISQLTEHYLKKAATGLISKTSPHALFTRSMKATNHKVLGTVQMVGSLSDIPKDKVVLGANFVKTGPGRKSKGKNAHRNSNGIDIIMPDNALLSTNKDHVGGSDPLPNSQAARNQANRGGHVPKLKQTSKVVFIVIDKHIAPYVNTGELKLDINAKQNPDTSTGPHARSLLETVDPDGSSAKISKLERAGAGLSAIGALFNVWNTVAAFNAWQAQGDLQKSAELTSAIVDLGYSVATAVSDFSKLLQKTKALEILKSTALHRNILRVAGVVGAALSFGLAVWQAIKEFKSGDKDAAFAQAVMAFGFAGGIAAEIGLLLGAAWAGPVGWIALGIVLLGALLYLVFNDSELEHWAKNGPFRKSDADLDDELKWMHNDQDGFPTYEYLMSVFYKPDISFDYILKPSPNKRSVNHYTGDFIAKFKLPVMFPNAKVVDLEGYVEILTRKNRINPNYNKNNPRSQPYSREVDEYRSNTIIMPDPVHGELVTGEDGRMHRFNFRGEKGGTEYTYYIKGRIQANDKLQFPVTPRMPNGKRIEKMSESWSSEYQTPWNSTKYMYGKTTFIGETRGWKESKSSEH